MAKRTGLEARSTSVKAALLARGEGQVSPEDSPPAPAATTARKKSVVLSLRLPPELHEQIRTIAFEQRVSLHALLLEGVEAMVQNRLAK